MLISQLMFGVLSASLASTLVIIINLFLRKILLKYIGAKWNYYVIFSIFIPWLFVWFPWDFWTPAIVTLAYKVVKPILTADLVHPPIFSKIFIQLTNGSSELSYLTKILFCIWVIGVFICLSFAIFQHLRFVFTLKKSIRLLTANERIKIKESLTVNQAKYVSRIYLSSLIPSAMLCHLFRPKIYLPEDFFSTYSEQEQKHILQHEFLHLKRHDLLSNLIMLIFRCINWFNPVIFFGYRYFRTAQELSCDTIVTKNFTNHEKKSYGQALLKTVINQ